MRTKKVTPKQKPISKVKTGRVTKNVNTPVVERVQQPQNDPKNKGKVKGNGRTVVNRTKIIDKTKINRDEHIDQTHEHSGGTKIVISHHSDNSSNIFST